jgi:hypothetical protein
MCVVHFTLFCVVHMLARCAARTAGWVVAVHRLRELIPLTEVTQKKKGLAFIGIVLCQRFVSEEQWPALGVVNRRPQIAQRCSVA